MSRRPDDPTRAFALFEQALELEGDHRSRFLDEACGGDPALLGRVRAMLRADAAGHALLDGSAGGLAARWAEPAAGSWAGRSVGPYRLLRELGRGGMGVVYLARRADVDFRVAVKLLAGSVGSPERAARFDYERRVLARLEHPHIARFLDAGVTPDGTPWLAMEYVEGHPIDVHCDARCLTVPERLALFAQAGEAVAYAHQNRLVHRDLKPSNILVSEAGVPKLVDFGIAKLLGGDGPVTEDPGRAPMTPDYASPEQVRGEEITPASDVYQLGIVLHELLTGRRPSKPNGDPLQPYDRAECGPVLSPSVLVTTEVTPAQVVGGPTARTAEELSSLRRVAPAQLRRQLAGDLDAIVRSAMRCDSALRYPSARELVDDLRRHRKGLPIQASDGSLAYRAGKLIGRHRIATGLAAAMLLLAAASALVLVVQARSLARERERAAQLAAVLEDLVLRADPARRDDDTTATRALLRGVVAQGRARLQSEPGLWGRTLVVAGDVYKSAGRADTAIALWREVVSALEPRSDPLDPVLLLALGMLGTSLVESGDVAGGLPLLERLESRARTLPPSRRRDRAESLYKVAWGRQAAGHDGPAARLNAEVLGLLAGLPDSGGIIHDRTLINLGGLANRRGDFAAAESLFRHAVAIRRVRDGPEHERTMNAAIGLADALLGRGDLAGADSVSRLVLAVRERLYQTPHPLVAASLLQRAEVELARGRAGEAERLGQAAARMYREVHGEGHPLVARADGVAADARHGAARPRRTGPADTAASSASRVPG